MDQKLEHARAFRDGFNIRRPILVDDVRGSGHQLYGGLSNMTFIVGRGGSLLYKANWTDPGFVHVAVDYFQGVRDQRKEGVRLAPYGGEILGYRVVDHEAWFSGIGARRTAGAGRLRQGARLGEIDARDAGTEPAVTAGFLDRALP